MIKLKLQEARRCKVGRKFKLTEEQKEELIIKYNEDKPLKEIAKYLNISTPTLYSYLKIIRAEQENMRESL